MIQQVMTFFLVVNAVNTHVIFAQNRRNKGKKNSFINFFLVCVMNMMLQYAQIYFLGTLYRCSTVHIKPLFNKNECVVLSVRSRLNSMMSRVLLFVLKFVERTDMKVETSLIHCEPTGTKLDMMQTIISCLLDFHNVGLRTLVVEVNQQVEVVVLQQHQ